MKPNLFLKALVLVIVITVFSVVGYGAGWKDASDRKAKGIDNIQSEVFTAEEENNTLIWVFRLVPKPKV